VDKLRAIEYFVCAAREGSLSAAARRLDVSVPAVSKLISSLERALGARLFARGTSGLALTPAGQEYLDVCAPALEQITGAEESVGRARTQAAGPVALAVQHVLAVHCLSPALGRFQARRSNVHLDLRDFMPGGADTEGADLRLAMIWDETPDQVMRVLARTKLVVCAAPQYWARHGAPSRPKDLEHHACLTLRSLRGTLTDHWPFVRGIEKEAAVVNGWLSTSNTNRDLVVAAALAGLGIVRTVDIAIAEYLRAGQLVPVLMDWEIIDSPLVRLMYRPAAGRMPRVRVVMDFLVELFKDTERQCVELVGDRPAGSAPAWAGPRPYRRASTAAAQRNR
jgi:LysR family transcriptional regulator, regulator for bpeEF and oprC